MERDGRMKFCRFNIHIKLNNWHKLHKFIGRFAGVTIYMGRDRQTKRNGPLR